MKKSKKGAKKHRSDTSKKKIFIIFAALLVIAAAIALAFVFAGDGQTGDDGVENTSESSAATLAEHFKKLKLEGKIASNNTFSEDFLRSEEKRLLGEGVNVKLISGCSAVKGEDTVIAHECASAADAQILYRYYTENLISTHTAVIRGTTVVSGPAGFLEDVLRGFS